MSGDRSKDGLQKLGKSLGVFFGEVRRANELRGEKQKQEKARRAKITQDYNDWLGELRPEAEKAAGIIFEWARSLTGSDSWRQFKAVYGSLISGVVVSCDITYSGPTNNPYHPYGTQQGHQSLSLDFDGVLRVSNNVKYGRTHEINSVEEMLRKVDSPIIIKVAETINNGTVWDVAIKETGRNIRWRIAELKKRAGRIHIDDSSGDDDDDG